MSSSSRSSSGFFVGGIRIPSSKFTNSQLENSSSEMNRSVSFVDKTENGNIKCQNGILTTTNTSSSRRPLSENFATGIIENGGSSSEASTPTIETKRNNKKLRSKLFLSLRGSRSSADLMGNRKISSITPISEPEGDFTRSFTTEPLLASPPVSLPPSRPRTPESSFDAAASDRGSSGGSNRKESKGKKDKSKNNEQVCTSEIPLGVILGSNNVGSSLGSALANGTRLGVIDGQLSNGIAVPTDLSDSSDSEGETELIVPSALNLPVEIPVCPVPHGEGRTIVNAVIPCDVDQLFTMLFTNSKFYLDFHLSRKTFNIIQSDWTENEEKNTVRQVSFTVSLTNKMGPKHSQVTETQMMLPVSKPGLLYAVDAESVNAGIPYADAFYVTCHFCMSRVSPRESRLIIICQVKYSKSVWVKPFIEKNSYAGLEEFYTSLVKGLNEECRKSSVISPSPPASPRIVGKSGSLPRVRRRGGKRRAPDIPTGVAPLAGGIELPCVATQKPGMLADIGIPSENTFFIKIILSILTGLLLLNGFLYVKLAQLETAAHTPLVFSTQPVSYSNDMPQNHQEWLQLLQKQEALHRFELQKWHDILLSALKILHQAESDLESLKVHITSYAEGRVKEIPSYFKTPQEPEPEKENPKNDNKDRDSNILEDQDVVVSSNAKDEKSEL